MNAANVIPLSSSQSVPYAKRTGRGAVSDPVHVCFGSFELDEADARLLRDGTALPLAPKPFGLLCALVRRPGSLLSKNELLDDVWGHQFVSESVLKTAISDLRTVLDDHPKQPRFIETVCRRGYRFIAATTAMPNAGAAPARASVSAIAFRDQSRAQAAAADPSGARGRVCGAKRAADCTVPKVPASRRETDFALAEPVFPTMEEVCYAHELRLRLRTQFLHAALQ